MSAARPRGEEFLEVEEGVEVTYLPADQRDAQVGALQRPWIGDEGPLDADFRRLDTDVRQLEVTATLRLRGLAFDDTTTVLWDEDAVLVTRQAARQEGEPAFAAPLLVRRRFALRTAFYRIDVLRRGVLLASRYTTQEPAERKDHA